MATLSDSYSETNQCGQLNTIRVGQSFTSDSDASNVLSSAEFYLKRTGADPTGKFGYAKVYAHSGVFGTSSVPTGTALATSDAVNLGAVGESYGYLSFSFSGAEKITLDASTNYFLALEYSGTTVFAGNDNGSDGSAPTHPGNEAYGAVSWTAESGQDLIFKLYEEPAPGLQRYGSPTRTGIPGHYIEYTASAMPESSSPTWTDNTTGSLGTAEITSGKLHIAATGDVWDGGGGE